MLYSLVITIFYGKSALTSEKTETAQTAISGTDLAQPLLSNGKSTLLCVHSLDNSLARSIPCRGASSYRKVSNICLALFAECGCKFTQNILNTATLMQIFYKIWAFLLFSRLNRENMEIIAYLCQQIAKKKRMRRTKITQSISQALRSLPMPVETMLYGSEA